MLYPLHLTSCLNSFRDFINYFVLEETWVVSHNTSSSVFAHTMTCHDNFCSRISPFCNEARSMPVGGYNYFLPI